MNDLKILIVGSGSAGFRHHEYAKKYFKNCQLAVLSQHSKPSFTANLFENIESAKDFNADLVVIANAAVNHMKIFSQLVSSKQLCIIEKPISSDFFDLQDKFADFGLTHQNVMVAYQLRFSQSLLALKAELISGRIGEILSVRIQIGQYLPDWRKASDYRESVSARAELGGGVLNELSHEIDLLFWLFGTPELSFSHHSKRSLLTIDVEDFAEFITTHSNREGSHYWSVNVTLDMFRRDPIRVCEVIGEYGTLSWNGIEGTLWHFDGQSGKKEIVVKDSMNPHDLFWNEVKNFVSSRKHSGATFQEAVSVLEFIHLLKSSNVALDPSNS